MSVALFAPLPFSKELKKTLQNVTSLSEIIFVVHLQQCGMFHFNMMPGAAEKTEKNK